MTHEELTNAISELVTKPESAAANAATIIKEVDALYTNADSLTAQAEENEKKIRELQDANIKLFLAQTGKPIDNHDDEDELTLEDFAKKMLGREEK